jgi:GAF domain-containing protein
VNLVDDQQFNAALAHAARTINQARTPAEAIQTIAETALLSIPSMEHVGVSVLDRRHQPETVAATSDLVRTLDKLQYSLDEGPCVDSLRDATVVAAPRISDDPRWPRYAPAAARLGLKAQLAVKLYLDEQGTVGGLNMYSTTSEEIHPEAPGIADLFATHAALALGKAREVDHLHQALRTREVIGQAVGLLMSQYSLDTDAAFAFLVRTSSHSNLKVRDIAERMVESHQAEVNRERPPG